MRSTHDASHAYAHTRAHAPPAPCAQPLNFAGATLALRGVGEIEGLFETTRLRFHDLPVRDKGDGPRLGLGLGLGLGLTLTITLTLTLTLILPLTLTLTRSTRRS